MTKSSRNLSEARELTSLSHTDAGKPEKCGGLKNLIRKEPEQRGSR